MNKYKQIIFLHRKISIEKNKVEKNKKPSCKRDQIPSKN